MRVFTTIICLLIVGFASAYSPHYSNVEQKYLMQLVASDPMSSDTTRLYVIDQLAKISKSDRVQRAHYTNMLLKEAKMRKNTLHECKAYLYHIFMACNMFDVKAVNYWMELLEPVALSHGYYTLYFQGKLAVLDMMALSEDFELAETEANNMLALATKYNCPIGVSCANQALGNVYISTYRYRQAIEYFEKAYEIASREKEYIMVNEICSRLVDLFFYLKDFNNQLKYIRLSEQSILDLIQSSPDEQEACRYPLLIVNINYLNYYLALGQLDIAAKYVEKSTQYFSNEYYLYELYYRIAHRNYYRATGQYDKAIAQIDSLISRVETEAIRASTLNFNKADMLLALGRNTEALNLYKAIWPREDSILRSVLDKQIARLKTDYNADVLLLEKEQIRQTTQLTMILSVSIITCVLLFFAFIAYRIRKRLTHEELEILRMNKKIDHANMAKERFLSNIKTAICIPLNVVVEDSLLLAADDNGLDADRRKEISTLITSTSAELMQLINNILDLSRMEAGMMKFHVDSSGLFLLLCEVMVELELKGNVEVEMNLEDDDDQFLKIDVSKFRSVMQAMLNKVDGSKILVVFETFDDGKFLQIRVQGSKLSQSEQSQDMVITNEINRMLIEYFGGSYTINHPSDITIVLPVSGPPSLGDE